VVTKAIIPAGGLGTRFLPATKILPKEMIPILDKPAIQHVVEEGFNSGINDFIIITGKNKNIIEDHFDSSPELEKILKNKNKDHVLRGIKKVVDSANFIYIRQKEPLGLGHAVWTARSIVGKERIAIFLPDDIIVGQKPFMEQLIKVSIQEKCSVIAVQEVPIDQVSRYGVVSIRRQLTPNLFHVKGLVEKPSISEAPSNLAIVGRYVLSHNIFQMLDEQKIGAGGEIQLTDAIQALILNGEKVFACKVQGKRYDTGNPLGHLKACIDYAIKHSEYSEDIVAYLQDLDKEFLIMEGKASALGKQKQISL
jgi:UTP--glucose-1-phosphate uridylyltransferase